MQFCKAQLRAVKAKTGPIAIGCSIGEGRICRPKCILLEHRRKATPDVAPVAFMFDVQLFRARGSGRQRTWCPATALLEAFLNIYVRRDTARASWALGEASYASGSVLALRDLGDSLAFAESQLVHQSNSARRAVAALPRKQGWNRQHSANQRSYSFTAPAGLFRAHGGAQPSRNSTCFYVAVEENR